MSEVGPIPHSRATAATSFARIQRTGLTAGAAARGTDRVDFSNQAQLLSRLSELPEVRQDLIDRVRGEINSDTYLTDDKIETALDRLLEDI